MRNSKAELVDLLYGYLAFTDARLKAQSIAEAIIADGWVNPPVEKGQTVYVIEERATKTIELYLVKRVLIDGQKFQIRLESTKTKETFDITEEALDSFVFLSESSARAALEVTK